MWKNIIEGKAVWKVVEKINKDELKVVREREEGLFQDKIFHLNKLAIEDDKWD